MDVRVGRKKWRDNINWGNDMGRISIEEECKVYKVDRSKGQGINKQCKKKIKWGLSRG